MSVDCTDVAIQEIWPYVVNINNDWWSEKLDGPGLRYEVALVIKTGHIAWINGPFPCGLFNDMKIFSKCGLKDELDENERVEADDGYKSYDPIFTKTRTGFSTKYKEK